jgi:hypothetical protein
MLRAGNLEQLGGPQNPRSTCDSQLTLALRARQTVLADYARGAIALPVATRSGLV